MNESIKVWLDALRSGKYKQGRRMMYNPTIKAYCCLGVADEAVFGATFDDSGSDDAGCSVFLIEKRARALNLHLQVSNDDVDYLMKHFDYTLRNTHTRMTLLASLNDRYGVPFTKIADIIEGIGWNR